VTSQIADLTNKLHRAETSVNGRANITHLSPEVAATKARAGSKDKTGPLELPKTEDTPLSKAIKDSDAVDSECRHGLFAQQIKVRSLAFEGRANGVAGRCFQLQARADSGQCQWGLLGETRVNASDLHFRGASLISSP
jgi:hypothetical protein